VVLAAAFAVFLALIIGLADTASLGVLHGVYDWPYGDKLGHFTLYGTLALLIGLALLQRRPDRRPSGQLLTGYLIMILLVTLEELSQAWIPTRSPDPFDLTASYLGVFAGALAAIGLRRASDGGRSLLAAKADPEA